MGIRNKISAGYFYYCTLTIVEWIDIFSRPVYKHLIVDSLNYCIKEKGLKVYCWCLMSNHLHIIASASDDGNLSDILRDFKKFTLASRDMSKACSGWCALLIEVCGGWCVFAIRAFQVRDL